MKTRSMFAAVLLLLTAGMISCKKNNVIPPASTSLTVVNAIAGSNSLIPSFLAGAKPSPFAPDNFHGGGTSSSAHNAFNQEVLLYNSRQYTGYSNNITLSLAQNIDTNKIVFTHTFNLVPGTIHSLYLAGTLDHPDFLYLQDTIPAIKDSVYSVRFINLSTGSHPVSINLQETPDKPAVNNLPYKGITGFIKFPAKAAEIPSSQYTFEIRDVQSGVVLTTFTLIGYQAIDYTGKAATLISLIFKSVTIALVGTPDDGSGNGTQQAILINNY